ncbi:MAG: ATP phosphoribosyltransferase [bacterium]|nr:ATP phosphoribosyltransferase [bacterium]
MTDKKQIVVGLPSKGRLAEEALEFLKDCGLNVARANTRQYIARLPALPSVVVLFQRAGDIVWNVANGSAMLGITGFDLVSELSPEQDGDIIVLKQDIGFGNCKLVLAIPESWVDVETVDDLRDISLSFREQKRGDLRIATKYQNLVREYLYDHDIVHFSLVKFEGAIEATPNLGIVDIVADLTETGTTLSENHLKQIQGGTILSSQACVIANRQMLIHNPTALETARTLLEFIDATLNARAYYSVTANIKDHNAAEIAQLLSTESTAAGLLGPMIAPVYVTARGYEKNTTWHGVKIIVEKSNLYKVISHLRSMGGTRCLPPFFS